MNSNPRAGTVESERSLALDQDTILSSRRATIMAGNLLETVGTRRGDAVMRNSAGQHCRTDKL
jgi:hypothetical protein